MIGQARTLGAKALGRANRAANVVAMSIPASKLTALTRISGVVSVKPVARYEVQSDPGGSGSLAQAADYLQATPARDQGFDGTGVKLAVLDSGVDYTHEYLGGPGTVDAYNTCFAQNAVAPTGICADLFGPNAPKVKGGADFVGEKWNGAANTPPLAPDPNPIDFEGHGTHVSDIAAGRSADGTHKGIAPGADLYVVKVCSSVSTACSGVAMLEGIDWVLDPNGDGDISDAMDVVNLSIGSPYGQEQDDTTLAIDNAVRAGVVAVLSAGNNADRPFIVGSPVDRGPGDQRGPDRAARRQAADDRDRQGHHGPQLPAADLEHPAERHDHRAAGAVGRRAEHHRGLRGGGLRQLPGRRGRADPARHLQRVAEGAERAGRRCLRGDHLEQRGR